MTDDIVIRKIRDYIKSLFPGVKVLIRDGFEWECKAEFNGIKYTSRHNSLQTAACTLIEELKKAKQALDYKAEEDAAFDWRFM